MSILPEYPVVQDWFKTQLDWGGVWRSQHFILEQKIANVI